MTEVEMTTRISDLKARIEEFRALFEMEQESIIKDLTLERNTYSKAPFDYRAPIKTVAKRLGPTGDLLIAKAEYDSFSQTLIQLKALADPTLRRMIAIRKSPKSLDIFARIRRRTRRN